MHILDSTSRGTTIIDTLYREHHSWLYAWLNKKMRCPLLAVPLSSYIHSMIIMLVIPFGFIGAVAGHLLLQIPLSLESYFALFAVGGIVINESYSRIWCLGS